MKEITGIRVHSDGNPATTRVVMVADDGQEYAFNLADKATAKEAIGPNMVRLDLSCLLMRKTDSGLVEFASIGVSTPFSIGYERSALEKEREARIDQRDASALALS